MDRAFLAWRSATTTSKDHSHTVGSGRQSTVLMATQNSNVEGNSQYAQIRSREGSPLDSMDDTLGGHAFGSMAHAGATLEQSWDPLSQMPAIEDPLEYPDPSGYDSKIIPLKPRAYSERHPEASRPGIDDQLEMIEDDQITHLLDPELINDSLVATQATGHHLATDITDQRRHHTQSSGEYQDEQQEGEMDDLLIMQQGLATFEDSMRSLVGSSAQFDDPLERRRRRGSRSARGTQGGQTARRVRTRGGQRGPRRAAEPTGDVKYRINLASEAYLDGRPDEAIELLHDAIRINAEIHRAWQLLAEILREKGEHKDYMLALVCAAHLQPKVTDGWMNCAQEALRLRGEHPDDADEYTRNALFSFSALLRADGNNKGARLGRAALYQERGSDKNAIADYTFLVKRCAYDTYALRGMAEASLHFAARDKREGAEKVNSAKIAYRRCIDHFRENGFDTMYPFSWEEVDLYIDLVAHSEGPRVAIYELKSLSRWLLGRQDQTFWDELEEDDREWDRDDLRRQELPAFMATVAPVSLYGISLPLELRTKLGIFRLELDQKAEAMLHLKWLDPSIPENQAVLLECPELVLEAGSQLFDSSMMADALRFIEPLIAIPGMVDAEALLQAGKCYLDNRDNRRAEECFTAALERDDLEEETAIEARFELAKMYEAAKADNEALLLVKEAISLQQARKPRLSDYEEAVDPIGAHSPPREGRKEAKRRMVRKKPGNDRSAINESRTGPHAAKAPPPKRRLRLFAPTEELLLAEKRRAEDLATNWRVVRESHEIRNSQAVETDQIWMAAAKELFDDFRSYKKFYPWERYLASLGTKQGREIEAVANPNLVAMAERLSHNLDPENQRTKEDAVGLIPVGYRGVAFREWLDLFLGYAMGLARNGKIQEAYRVCSAASDANVFSSSPEDMFLIHVAWGACALHGRDEETCVAVARYFMRENPLQSDAFRMFSALTRLCASSPSWYMSGPTQKYMLRQIKLVDASLGVSMRPTQVAQRLPNTASYSVNGVDVALLMLYGHILIMSNSYTYALNYFFRAQALDPENPMINLSIGQGYIHYGMKRQSDNRQFLVTQGLVFMHKYYETKLKSASTVQKQEAHYNMGRSYHSLGLSHLAIEFYRRALDEKPAWSSTGLLGSQDLSAEAAYNMQSCCLVGGDYESVRTISDKWLVI